MKDKRKATPTRSGNILAGEQISYCKYNHRSGKSKRKIHFSDTQSQAFAAIHRLHEIEMRKARKFFLEHPTRTYSRVDLVEVLEQPINHITRIVYDLLDAGFIRITGKDRNPRSGITVEMLQLTGKEAIHG
ncbi:hypothetical protein [Alistipes indistinctus]|nr:hypothetical protein [Alistipes indistinctus]UWN58777.1 hypothetical protein NQ495_08595 [Alistipes indistinctus YIT 12060]